MKVVLATHDKIYVIQARSNSIESQFDHELTSSLKLYPVSTGFAIMSGNSIVVKKLNSLGVVDESYQACSTLSSLIDMTYDWKNPNQIMALTEASNELLLFTLQGTSHECQVFSKKFLSSAETPFDKVEMMGPLVTLRAAGTQSVSFYKSDSDNYLEFMRKESRPAVY